MRLVSLYSHRIFFNKKQKKLFKSIFSHICRMFYDKSIILFDTLRYKALSFIEEFTNQYDVTSLHLIQNISFDFFFFWKVCFLKKMRYLTEPFVLRVLILMRLGNNWLNHIYHFIFPQGINSNVFFLYVNLHLRRLSSFCLHL